MVPNATASATGSTARTYRRAKKGPETGYRLLPHESYVIKVAGDKVAKGTANAEGKVAKKVRISSKLDPGQVNVVVRGATKKRSGKDVVKVVAATDRVVPRTADPRVARVLV
jgi:hypothetical protein